MSETMLNINYRCQHPSCQVFCKKGKLEMEESKFEELSASYDEEGIFKSPKETCRMGFSQPFKLISLEEVGGQDVSSGASPASDSGALVAALMEEHKEVLRKLDIVESQFKRRQVEELWVSTAALEDEIMRHSVEKEEGVLFPLLGRKVEMAQVYMQIIHEDHKEFISLLHSFRCGLQEGEILDGIMKSTLVNLRNHIRKEDDEFFTIVDENLSDKDKKLLLDKMKECDERHVTIEAGDRSEKINSPFLANREMLDAEINAIKQNSITDDWGCACNPE